MLPGNAGCIGARSVNAWPWPATGVTPLKGVMLLGLVGAGCAKIGLVEMLVLTTDVGGEVELIVLAAAAEIICPTVAGTTTLPGGIMVMLAPTGFVIIFD